MALNTLVTPTNEILATGIYAIGDIRFRQRFLSKCHLPAKHTDDPAYAVNSPAQLPAKPTNPIGLVHILR